VNYKLLKPGQLCNHFPNNQELTTKTGLARNLLRLTDYEWNQEQWFPRCYDFTDQRQIDGFLADYKKTSVVNYIKRHAIYFKHIHHREIKKLKKEIAKGDTWKKRAKLKYKSIYLTAEGSYKHVVNIKMLKIAITFLKYQIKSRAGTLDENAEDGWRGSKVIIKLSQCKGPPYDVNVLKEALNIVSEGWDIPSLYFEYKIIARVQKYNTVYPQSKIDGVENIWIVKPSFSSRGIGVHCINGSKDELAPGKKVQAKVIQKYIERPFLLLLPGPRGKLEKRKFDIRQWVLVTSINPLIVYMFNSCYLKICGSEFSLRDFKDKYKHISNFSIQKNNQRITKINDLIMNVEQFIAHLKEHYNIKLDWEKDMLPKLGDIVKATIYSGSDVIKHKDNCFELYGFDFVLDHNLNPWLIEVNLSPACKKRTTWLSEMLSKICSKV